MDKLAFYRKAIQTLLEEYSSFRRVDENIENELFFDTQRDHYQLMCIGWEYLKRVYHTMLHFDIKDGKIWL